MTATNTDLLPRAPAQHPLFAPILAERWQADRTAEDPLEIAVPGTRIRHSRAGGCSRSISYELAGVPESDPADLTFWWNVGIGKILHDAWQAELQRRFPEAEVEVKVTSDDSGLTSGHVDANVNGAEGLPRRLTIEVKTQGGFGYKKMVGASTGRKPEPPEGPKLAALLQGALNARANDADLLVIVVLAKEAISVRQAEWQKMPDWLRIGAEWHYPRELYEPLADGELERLGSVAAATDAGMRVPRWGPEMPEGTEIVDVAESRYAGPGGSGKVWSGSWCAYCRWCSHCAAELKAGR